MKITRRGFLISGAAIGGGLVLGFSLWPDAPLKLTANEGEVILNGWVKIDRDGIVHVVVPQAEMGQGITTGLSMALAEELDADFDNVRFEFAPVDDVYVNDMIITDGLDGMSAFVKPLASWAGNKIAQLFNMQITGGSTSIRHFLPLYRQAGAMARNQLIEAAARRLAVPKHELITSNSYVVHEATDTKISYANLVEDAAKINPDENVSLKEPSQFKLIGKSAPRLDIPAKVTGEAQFGIDVRLPNMVFAAIRAVPTAGGKVSSVDISHLDSDANIIKTIVNDGFVAVVASHYWYAKKAVEGLDIKFVDVPNVASHDIHEKYNRDLAEKQGHDHIAEGDLQALEGQAGSWIEARYDVPFLAHSCLEPMNCTVYVRDGICDVWAPTQASGMAQDAAADVLEIDKENINVHTTFLGGGFGRKIEADCVSQGVEIAKQLDVPVQLIWNREEDTKHDFYRPKFAINMAAFLAEDGKILALKTKGTSQSVEASFESRMMGSELPDEPAPDVASVEGIDNTPYAFPNIWVEHVGQKEVIPVGFWRSVGHSNNCFFMESFMDEIAEAQGQDPFALRRQLLAHDPRGLKVLDVLEDVSNWRGAQSTVYKNEKSARGMSLHQSFGTWVGQVVDVVVVDGAIRVEKVSLVVDCGQVVNPNTIIAQMESGVIYGLTAALYGEITLDGGDVVESNFHDYQAVTMANSPEITTHIIADGHAHGGIGEPSTPPIAPAVANAVFAATGERIRKLPFKNNGFQVY